MDHTIHVQGTGPDDLTLTFDDKVYKFQTLGDGTGGKCVVMEPDPQRQFKVNPNLSLIALTRTAISYLLESAEPVADSYEALRDAVADVLRAIPQDDLYRFRQDYGGHFDGQHRTLVVLATGRSLRNSGASADALQRVKNALDTDGRFGSVLHYMAHARDWVLITQFGAVPILA